jgi:hypothetical protein
VGQILGEQRQSYLKEGALKTITLGLAERVLANNLIGQPATAKLNDARQAKAVRAGLALRAAEKEIERRQGRIEELRQQINQAQDKGSDEVRAAIAEVASLAPTWNNLSESAEAKEYKIEPAALAWLSDLLQARDWAQITTQQGQKVTVAVDPAMLEVVANLGDAVAAALTGA